MAVDRIRNAGAAVTIVALALLASSASAWAQEPGRPPLVGGVEAIVGHGLFADDGAIEHSVGGIAVPLRVSPRVWIGPEVLWMRGPGADRDLVLAVGVWFDIIGPAKTSMGLRERRIVPYVVGGGGLFSHSDEFVSRSEGYVGGGGGVRVQIAKGVYVAPEFQFGWEPHVRTIARVGYRFGTR